MKNIKRTLSFILTSALCLSLLATGVASEGFKPTRSPTCDIEFYVPKTEAEAVVKDGKIGEGEYHRLELDLTLENSPLYMVFGSDADGFTNALEMLSTMEYYFSWDDVHGLNIAVRCAPPDVQQILYVKENSPYPEDNFLSNTGFGFAFHDKNRINSVQDNLYYAIAKRTDTGEYLRGWWVERGLSGAYDPQPEQDFIIEYEADGHVTCEWSVPFSEIIKTEPSVGTKIYLSVSATSGDSTFPNIPSTYGISLGDRGYLVPQNNSSQHAVAILSGEDVDGNDTWVNPFEDVGEDDWFYGYVKYVNERGLMKGKSDGTFEPDDSMTRAELVTVLWRMEGEPVALGSMIFDDVRNGDWFKEAVIWANGRGIVEGFDDGSFRPSEPVTREQLTAIFQRYTKYLGGEISLGGELDYPDAGEVSDWALESVRWAVSTGLITGKPKDNKVYVFPKGEATRAELATMLERYGA